MTSGRFILGFATRVLILRLTASTARAWTTLIEPSSGSSISQDFNTMKSTSENSSNSSHNSRKKIIKESPLPPPRELVLASPDLVLKSGSRLSMETFRIYFDCLGPKRMLIENHRTRYRIFQNFSSFRLDVAKVKSLPNFQKTR